MPLLRLKGLSVHHVQKLLSGMSIALISLSLISLSAQAGPFTTPGQFSVGADGSASYSIPIQVPPGTAGMSPSLNLSYNSNGGNGILGLGWGLEGLSQITRCGKTIAQDGARGGINYDANDKFCLDGQRLIAITGTYGADGTEYRTELANFAKIISYGTAGTGPSWFKVWTKGGQIIEYGNTADSKIEAAGIATVRLWGVSKISDTKGNYLTATYIEDNPNGEAYLSRIDYTGNSTGAPTLTPYASVQLTYETRPDTNTAYQAGSVIKSTKRITDIKTYSNTTLIKDYKLTYTNTGAYHVNTSNVADGSVLTQLQECDGQTTPTCQKPITLTWTPGTVSTSVFGTAQTWPTGKVVSVADINGDGRADVLYDAGTGTGTGKTYGTLYVAFSTGSGFSGAYSTGVVGGSFTCDQVLYSACVNSKYTYTPPAVSLGDVNGDGLADLVTASGVYLSNGNTFSTLQNWPTGRIISVADINGDGRADVLYDAGTGTGTGKTYGTLYVAFSTGSGFSGAYSTGVVGGSFTCDQVLYSACVNSKYTYTPPAVSLGDVNGDGLFDLVTASGVSLTLSSIPDQLTSLSNGLGVSTSVVYKPLSATANSAPVYVQDTGANAAVYPIRDVLPVVPMYVVSAATTSDGIGGNITTTYNYGGAKVDMNGRGFLGYRYMTTSLSDNDSLVKSYYRQDYPYIGLPSSTEKRRLSNNTLLASQQTTYATQALGGTRQFPYVTQSVESSYELDGSLVSTATTTNQYDSYGNVTQISVTSNDGYTKTTTNSYLNDTTNWLLGRLLKSTVTTASP